MRIFEVPNITNPKGSFHRKAHQIELDDGTIQLQSYETIVAEIKNGKCKIHGTYSATTLRHIKSWPEFNNLPSGTKSEIEAMYG